MLAKGSHGRAGAALVAASVAFGALITWILPKRVILLNDDFGYLRSVVETVRHGRPWTDDWLEPWSAPLSAASALVFRMTGRFDAGILGLQPILAAATFAALCALLRSARFGTVWTIVLAGLLATFPTLLWKMLEYTGVALFLPCFLIALWACDRDRWGVFLAAWGTAIATRQSAVTWLVMPGLAIVRAAMAHRRGVWRPALVIVAGLLLFVVLLTTMNKTHAQIVITDRPGDVALRTALRNALIGVGAFLAAVGIGGFASAFGPHARQATRADAPPSNPAWAAIAWISAGILVAALVSFFFWPRGWILAEHPAFGGPIGASHARWLLGLAAVGWIWRRPKPRGDYVVYALAALVPVCLRRTLSDYYFLEILLLGFFSAFSPAASSPNGIPLRAVARAPARWVGLAALVVLAVLQMRSVGVLRAVIDEATAGCVLGERALRNGSIRPEETGFAPFGLRGWYLYPYWIAHDGRDSPELSGFWRYLTPDVFLVRSAPRFREDPGPVTPNAKFLPAELLETGVFPTGWFSRTRFALQRVRVAGARPARTLPDYRPTPFPLTNDEWRELIETGDLRPSQTPVPVP